MLTVTAYKERLLIYHAGYPTITGLVFVRVLSICAAAFVTFIWVPSYYAHGTPWYYLLPGEYSLASALMHY